MSSKQQIATAGAVHRIRWILAITIVCMTVEASISLFAAWRARSPALLAFGGDSAIELLSATRYDLVCGQGRMEACLALGETTIPAVVVDATREEQFLMSLVENIARRPPSNRALLAELRSLRQRNYKTDEIAKRSAF